jgi:hypothetical protein
MTPLLMLTAHHDDSASYASDSRFSLSMTLRIGAGAAQLQGNSRASASMISGRMSRMNAPAASQPLLTLVGRRGVDARPHQAVDRRRLTDGVETAVLADTGHFIAIEAADVVKTSGSLRSHLVLVPLLVLACLEGPMSDRTA